jgi:hypothetical protein
MKRSRTIATFAAVFLLPTTTIAAQSVSPDTARPEPANWSISLGVDPTSLDQASNNWGLNARIVGNLTRTWQAPGSRFSRHLSLMVGGDTPTRLNDEQQRACYGCWMSVARKYAGATAGVGVDLFSVSRLTPYIKTGAGAYYTRFSGDPGNGGLRPNSTLLPRNGFSFGVNGGMGLKMRLGSHELFVEQMLHAFDVRVIDKGVYPLNIGFKF